MVDLHVHSNKSDGTLSPRELVDYAIEKGLSAFALTDHDTVDGLEEAISYAKERGGIQVIPGIEFSTEYEGRDVHIVGLAIDHKEPRFAVALKKFVDSRHKRNQKMCDMLREGTGMDISYEKLLEEFPGAVITRAHYAKYMLNRGYIKSMKEAFDLYIGDHCPYYIPREKITPDRAIKLILASDGIPVLAHPILYHMSDDRLDNLVAQLKKGGLLGIEALYSTYNLTEERQIMKLAQKYRLLISGGSDFHGTNKPGLDLATGYGNLCVHDQVWEDLKNSRKKLLFTDMDGTLLRDDSTVSPEMKEGLNRMVEAGHHLILSSGRPLPSILEVREQAGLNYPHMLIISNNGALIYDCDARAPILELRISQKDIAVIVEEAHRAGLHIHGYTASEIVCLQDNDELRYYRRRIHLPLKCVKDIASALPQGSYKLQTIHLTDKARLEAFREKLLSKEDLAERIQVIFSNDQYLEILPKEAGKGTALHFIRDHLRVMRTHTFAAGDAENDISMIAAAQVGIAMKNASLWVKRCADFVTKKTNQEDGLLEALEKYGFYSRLL